MNLRKREYLSEASPVKLKELSAEAQKKVKAVEKIMGVKSSYYFSGIHGDIATFEISASMSPRLYQEQLKKLVALSLRWLQLHRDSFSIGI